MKFDPQIGDTVTIAGAEYEFQPLDLPKVKIQMVHCASGRKGTAYRVAKKQRRLDKTELYALKVFTREYRLDSIYTTSKNLVQWQNLKGLTVCKRQVIRETTDCPQLSEYKDLMNAVLMPWISGRTWGSYVGDKTFLRREDSLQLATNSATILSGLEKMGLAHCDISAGNIMVNPDSYDIELIDVEDMFVPNAGLTGQASGTTPGYGHRLVTGSDGWGPQGDRFAGAVLLAEMLCWHDAIVRRRSYQESFFEPYEIGTPCERFNVLLRLLKASFSPKLAELFETAWYSDNLSQCPPLTLWKDELSSLRSNADPQLAIDQLQLSQSSVEFGDISHRSVQRSLTLTNYSSKDVRVTILSPDALWISISPKEVVILAGKTNTISLTASTSERVAESLHKMGSVEVRAGNQLVTCDVSATVTPKLYVAKKGINLKAVFLIIAVLIILYFLLRG